MSVRGGCLAVVAALGVVACGGPVGPFAGGRLSGPDAEPPAQWQAVPDTIQLEVRPADPYSVNLWSVAVGAHLYVATGPEGSDWMARLQATRRVRVRVGSVVYALQAAAVDDPDERQRVVAAYKAKYGGADAGLFGIRERRRTAMESALRDGLIYRLESR